LVGLPPRNTGASSQGGTECQQKPSGPLPRAPKQTTKRAQLVHRGETKINQMFHTGNPRALGEQNPNQIKGWPPGHRGTGGTNHQVRHPHQFQNPGGKGNRLFKDPLMGARLVAP